MSKIKFATAVALFALGFATSPARAAWTYDTAAKTLADGTSGWVFNTTGAVADGVTNLTVTGVKTVGALSSDVDFRTVEADTACVITSIGGGALKKALTSVAFPDSVTSLGYYMCENQTTLTNVVLGAGLTTIPDGAFYGCTKLKTVTPFLPDTVKSVGGSAFNNCPVEGKLSLVNPDGVSVGGNAFRGTKIQDADFSGVVSLGINVFENQTVLTNLVLGTSLQRVPDFFCSGCTKLKTVAPFLPDSVTYVGVNAFNLAPVEGKLSLVNPDGVSVGGNAFRGTKIQDADLSGVTVFGNTVLEGQTSITNLLLGTTLQRIPDYFCSGCTKLARVSPFLPDSVTYVGGNAFYNCPVAGMLAATNVNGVAFGSSAFRYVNVTEAHLNVNGSMVNNIIGGAPNLRDVYFYGTPPSTYANNAIEDISAYRVNFHISTKRLPNYTALPGFAAATPTEKARADYPGDATTLGTFQPPNCNRQWLTSWTAPGDELPDVTLTVNSAHGAPTPAAGSIVLPNLTALDFSVASHRVGLTSYVCTGWSGTGDIPATGSALSLRALLTQDSAITWNWQVTTHEKMWIRSGSVLSNAVNRWAFNLSSATATENLVVNSTRTVGYADEIDFRTVAADTGCVITGIAGKALKTALTSVAFPDSVTSFGSYMCENVTSLTNVVLGAGLKTIGASAFVGCTSLQVVTPFLPDSVTSVGASAFSGTRVPTTLRLENKNGVALGGRAFVTNPFADAYINISGALPDAIFERCSALRHVWFLGAAPTSFHVNSLWAINAYVVWFHISRQQVPDPYTIPGFAGLDATDMARADYQAAKPKPYGTVTISGKRYWVVDWRSPLDQQPTVLIIR